jgi:hypothetical protein
LTTAKHRPALDEHFQDEKSDVFDQPTKPDFPVCLTSYLNSKLNSLLKWRKLGRYKDDFGN